MSRPGVLSAEMSPPIRLASRRTIEAEPGAAEPARGRVGLRDSWNDRGSPPSMPIPVSDGELTGASAAERRAAPP
jgi:hypothetical protein